MTSPKISSSPSPTIADLEAKNQRLEAENERLEAESLRLEARIEKLSAANKELKEEVDYHRQEGDYDGSPEQTHSGGDYDYEEEPDDLTTPRSVINAQQNKLDARDAENARLKAELMVFKAQAAAAVAPKDGTKSLFHGSLPFRASDNILRPTGSMYSGIVKGKQSSKAVVTNEEGVAKMIEEYKDKTADR